MKGTRVSLPYRPDYEQGHPITECLGCGAEFSGEHATLCSIDPAGAMVGAELTVGMWVAGDLVLNRGELRRVLSITAAAAGRLHVRFTDGTEAVADRSAVRYVLDQSDQAAA